eukprot:scaffold4918_cov80-Skeletonema_marinoi.AAC.2
MAKLLDIPSLLFVAYVPKIEGISARETRSSSIISITLVKSRVSSTLTRGDGNVARHSLSAASASASALSSTVQSLSLLKEMGMWHVIHFQHCIINPHAELRVEDLYP